MSKEINAIPTTYNGINFRSRLEAKWACFFDNIGWRYEYEPIDLNGYIPDFLIKGSHSQFFVEVKPATSLVDLKKLCEKARRKTIGYRLMCLGASLGYGGDWTIDPITIGLEVARLNLCCKAYADLQISVFGIGDINANEWDANDESTVQAVIGFYEEFDLIECDLCKALSPASEAYENCIECGSKLNHNMDTRKESFSIAESAWKSAGNTIQYQNSRKYREHKRFIERWRDQ